MIIPKKINKLGSSSSNINYFDGFYIKNYNLNNSSELDAIIKGIDIIADKFPETIAYPISIDKENLVDNKRSLSLTYKQKELKPWIRPEWITGEQLYQVGLTIIKQQFVLFKKGLCLVDARPENYWLAKSYGILVDLGSIKPLTRINLLSFEADFQNHFINPLVLEAELNIPVSQYFKGNIQTSNINLWGINRNLRSISFLKDSLKNTFINYVSNLISSSSPEFIEFLNIDSDSQKDIYLDIKKSIKIINRLEQKFKKLKPNIKIQSNWNNYEKFHDNSYNLKKINEIKKFVDHKSSLSKVVDLGSNLTTKSINNINIRIDNDLLTSREMRQIYNADQIILQIDIADCLCYFKNKNENPLNCGGQAKVAIITGLIHHLVIDYGLAIENFYKNIADLFDHILLEFPSANDPMVKLLIRKKNENIFWDWEKQHLPLCNKFFYIEQKIKLSPTRDLYQLTNRKFNKSEK